MKVHIGRIGILAAAAGLAVLLAPPLGATDIFRARMLTGKAPVEPPVVNVRIEIESYTTPQDVLGLQDAMNSGGEDAFLKMFASMKKGVVRIMDRRGWNLEVHAAQMVPTEKGRKLQLFMLRQSWDPGNQMVRTGADFFMVLELNLNEKNNGDGRLYEDAGINLAPLAGRIEMRRYGSAPKIIVMAAQVKKAP
ncbi:MAG TPA: hypothetical protein VLJ16_07565 [Acidobacteriota bacterium]|nr:hypothetical protein [Acidobacteriota bacterium]